MSYKYLLFILFSFQTYITATSLPAEPSVKELKQEEGKDGNEVSLATIELARKAIIQRKDNALVSQIPVVAVPIPLRPTAAPVEGRIDPEWVRLERAVRKTQHLWRTEFLDTRWARAENELRLGQIYLNGIGVAQDLGKAEGWFANALSDCNFAHAVNNYCNTAAQLGLGQIYYLRQHYHDAQIRFELAEKPGFPACDQATEWLERLKREGRYIARQERNESEDSKPSKCICQ